MNAISFILLYTNIKGNYLQKVSITDAISIIKVPNLNEFTFPIFFAVFNIAFCNKIHTNDDIIVIAVI